MTLFEGMLSFAMLMSLSACASLNNQDIQIKPTLNSEFPIGKVFKNMYIHGWENHLILQNNEGFEEYIYEYEYKTQPLDTDDLQIVDFHGREAIRLDRTRTKRYGLPNHLETEIHKNAMFIDPMTYRFIGATYIEESAFSQADIVTDIYPVPETAKLGDKALLSIGYAADFYEGKQIGNKLATFTENWHLTKASDNNANLCIVTHYENYKINGTSLMNECYLINQQGDILHKNDTLINNFDNYDKPQRFVSP